MNQSELKKYWTGFIVALVLLEILISFFPLSPPRLMREVLLEYQLEKLPSITEDSVVLVGDSSLGNGVDTVELSASLGRPVFNLALTGTESFAGDYLLLEALLETGNKPHRVVAAHSPDTYRREITEPTVQRLTEEIAGQTGDQGWSLKGTADSLFGHLHLVEYGAGYRHEFFQSGHGLKILSFEESGAKTAKLEAELTELDYLPQAKKRWDPGSKQPSFRAHPSQQVWLKKLDGLCRKHKISFGLVSGPLYEGSADADYRTDFRRFLQAQPAPVLTEEIPTYPLEQLGDEKDHLSPEGRQLYTKWLGEVLSE